MSIILEIIRTFSLLVVVISLISLSVLYFFFPHLIDKARYITSQRNVMREMRKTSIENVEENLHTGDRDFSEYDNRISAMQEELELFNRTDNNAIPLDSKVFNEPHSVVKMDIEQFPAVEEESESGIVEVGK